MAGMRIAGDCPKGCGRAADFRVERASVWVVCSCGYSKMEWEIGITGELERVNHNKVLVKLPKDGTRLLHCLKIIVLFSKATTREAADHDGSTSGDMATQLTILECKGLVTRINSKRRVVGGSTWVLTEVAKDLLNITTQME